MKDKLKNITKNQKGLLAGGVLGGLFLGANAGKIVRGISIGLVSLVIAFILTYSSVTGVREYSNEVAALDLVSITDVEDTRGLVKAYGQITADTPVAFELETCSDNTCETRETALSEEDLLYYEIELQRFEVVREVTREVEETGGSSDRTTETIEYRNEWVTLSEEEAWAEDTSFGDFGIRPDRARIIIDDDNLELTNVYIEDAPEIDTYDRTPDQDEPAFGSTRALVSFIPVDDREYTVVGELRSSGFTSGDLFVITDKSDTELVNQLGGEETATRWGMRFVAFLLFTFAFTSMLAPVLVFTDWIPLVGNVARGIATLVSAILAAIIVLATIFLLNFWWLVLLLIAASVLGFVYYTRLREVEAT